MSDLKLDVTIKFRDFALETKFQGDIRILAITGRSGIGKTSLLNAIAGLITPARGHIKLDHETLFDHEHGINIAPRHRRIGYVFQDARLFPHMTVSGNLDYAAYQARKRPAVMDRKRLVDLLGIAPLLHRYPDSLSGGEQQRVAIARALLSAPRLLLLDEPLSAIDSKRREMIRSMLIDLKQEIAVPMILVSHSAEDIAQLSDHELSLDHSAV